MIIAVAGKKQSGKGSFTKMLIEKLTNHSTVVKEFSFADILKTFLIKTSILTYKQAYGNEEDRASLTNVAIKNIPLTALEFYIDKESKEQEYLNAREVMQFFGTNIMRKIFHEDVWVNATISDIHSWMDTPTRYPIAILSDTRFKNELSIVKKSIKPRGITVYISRTNNPTAGDSHISENDINPKLCDFHFTANTLDELDALANEFVKEIQIMIKNRKEVCPS